MTDLPSPVREFVDTVNAHDEEGFLDAFTDDGYVDDWGRTFTGREAIKGWSDKEFIGATGVLTPRDITVDGEQVIEFGGDQPYGLEAAGLARAVAGDGLVSEMSLADSLGNARVLDTWREQIGLRYPFEADDSDLPTVSGLPLQVRADAVMPYGKIDGLDLPVSRLVMGCDNQQTLAHASAMFDHFFAAGGNTFDTGYIYGGPGLVRALNQLAQEPR